MSISQSPLAEHSSNGEYDEVDDLMDDNLYTELSEFVAIKTYRGGDLTESEVVTNLQKIQDALMAQVDEFNKTLNTHKIAEFEWKEPVPDDNSREYWLFGLRLGNGPYKIALCCHLDTVPPGDDQSWKPFELAREKRDYLGKTDQEFYVGRGSIDDKGPATVAFNVLKAVAQRYDGSDKLEKITIEILFDTSEETDMAMPHYLAAEKEDTNPNFGLIYDAEWSIRAEKGIERPVFEITRNQAANADVWIDLLNTPVGPSNQIPETTTAIIRSESADELSKLSDSIEELYAKYPFDDPDYHRAKMTVELDLASKTLTLQTEVEGAQHGSAPDENRADGANPLVSLANFLAGLVDRGTLASNEIGGMCQFIAQAWGTKVFGEHHPELLERYDQVFQNGNGTTYAVTRMFTETDSVRLELDIRYAIGHHSQPWDGVEGMLKGEKSIFGDVFGQMTEEFNRNARHPVTFTTATADAPDIRLPEGESFRKVARAYKEVMGEPTPARAIGGGTDAKGHNELIAAGALFTDRLGPPINFHGINEGAPVEDLKKGARIIYRLFVDETEASG